MTLAFDIEALKATPKVMELDALVKQCMNDPDFLSDSKRIDKAVKGFGQPDLTDRVIKQIRTQVEKDLYKELGQGKRKVVTPDDIKVEVQVRYLKHLERKQGTKDDSGFIASIKAANQ